MQKGCRACPTSGTEAGLRGSDMMDSKRTCDGQGVSWGRLGGLKFLSTLHYPGADVLKSVVLTWKLPFSLCVGKPGLGKFRGADGVCVRAETQPWVPKHLWG